MKFEEFKEAYEKFIMIEDAKLKRQYLKTLEALEAYLKSSPNGDASSVGKHEQAKEIRDCTTCDVPHDDTICNSCSNFSKWERID